MSSVSEKVVRITMKDGLPVPDQDPVTVKKDNQKVRWAADFDFRITVDDYADVTYSAGGGEFSAKSGAFNRNRRSFGRRELASRLGLRNCVSRFSSNNRRVRPYEART